MERNEIITLAFSRPIDPELISTGDINQATRTYVNRYIADVDNAFLALSATKDVIAYGVAFDLFDRIDLTISDRGIYKLSIEGTAPVNDIDKMKLRGAMYRRLIQAMRYMIERAEEEGYTTRNESEVGLNIVSSKSTSTSL